MTTAEEQPAFLSLPLPKREPPKDRMINVSGLQVRIVDERYEERDAEGRLVSPEDYLRKVRAKLQIVCASLFELRARRSDPARRRELLAELDRRQIALDVLTEIVQRPAVDSYDLLAHPAFDEGLRSREERAVALFNLHQDFFATYNAQAREVLATLVERYVQGGVDEILDPRVFTLPPIRQEARQVAVVFGGMKQLVTAVGRPQCAAQVRIDNVGAHGHAPLPAGRDGPVGADGRPPLLTMPRAFAAQAEPSRCLS